MDGQERLRIIDRSGQMVEMYSPVNAGNNQGNATQRGNSVAPGGIGIGNVTEAFIRLLDLEGQEIIVDAKNQYVQMKDKEGQFIKLDAQNQKITISGEEKEEVLQGGKTVTVQGTKTETVAGAATEQYASTWTVLVGGAMQLQATLDASLISADTVTIQSGVAITLSAPIINIV